MAKKKDLRKHKTPPPPKQKGQKDTVPGMRRIKASIRSILEEVVENRPLTVRNALMRGIKAHPQFAHHYLKMAAEYLDGRPGDHLTIKFDMDEVADAKKSLHQKLDAILNRLDEPKS